MMHALVILTVAVSAAVALGLVALGCLAWAIAEATVASLPE